MDFRGGRQGGLNSRFPYLLLPLPTPFLRGSCLFVLFLLKFYKIFLLFSQFLPLWKSCFLPFLLLPLIPLPPPILPGPRPPVPPPPPTTSRWVRWFPRKILHLREQCNKQQERCPEAFLVLTKRKLGTEDKIGTFHFLSELPLWKLTSIRRPAVEIFFKEANKI